MDGDWWICQRLGKTLIICLVEKEEEEEEERLVDDPSFEALGEAWDL